jgi:hypothetical protein
MGGTSAMTASSSSNAALTLGMLAQSATVNNGNGYNPDENQSNEQGGRSEQYQSG